MSGPIPGRQLFNNFTKLSNEELLRMTLPELEAYASTVSTTVNLEQSSIQGNQKAYIMYGDLVNASQSTVDGLGYEIAANTLLLQATDMQISDLSGQSAAFLSTIMNYESTMDAEVITMKEADDQISSLMIESGAIDSTLNLSQLAFASTAKYYSSLYMTFMAKDLVYQNRLTAISTTSSILAASIQYEKITYDNWQTSTASRQAIDTQLTALYNDSNAIQSTLTQYRIDETLAIGYYNSTSQAVNTISSLYAASLLNQQYYQALSTQTGYTDALAAATNAASNAKRASLAAPSDTTLSAAATLAKTLVTTITTKQTDAMSETAALQQRLPGITTDTYAATIAQYENQVQIEIDNISTFDAYKTMSLKSLMYYSSQYDQAVIDIASSMVLIDKYGKLYDSSIAGSNALMAIVQKDTTSIAEKMSEVTAISMTLSSLVKDYDMYQSSFTGYVTISTIMKQQVDKATADLAVYSSFYDSTSFALATFSKEFQDVQAALSLNTATLYSQSSMLAYETNKLCVYKAQLDDSFNIQERATYQYRETYVREKRIAAQLYYDSIIANEIQKNSTINGEAAASVGLGVPVIPIPLDLNTPDITLGNKNLTTITGFLNTFTDIYGNYDTQTINLQKVSTTAGLQREALDALTLYQNKYMTAPTPDNLLILNSAQNDYNFASDEYNGTLGNVEIVRKKVDLVQVEFRKSYADVFRSDEIIKNEDTISSFLKV
jgi:hypothetical protein